MPRPGRSCEGLDPSENWSLVADPKLRRRIQNRINARIHRQRVAVRYRGALLRQEQENQLLQQEQQQQQQQQHQSPGQLETQTFSIPDTEQARRQELLRERWRREFIQDKRQRYLEQVQEQESQCQQQQQHQHHHHHQHHQHLPDQDTAAYPYRQQQHALVSAGQSQNTPYHNVMYSHYSPGSHFHFASEHANIQKRARSHSELSRVVTTTSIMSNDLCSAVSAPSPSSGPCDVWPSPRSPASSAASVTGTVAAAASGLGQQQQQYASSWQTYGSIQSGAAPSRFELGEYEYSAAQYPAPIMASGATTATTGPVAHYPEPSTVSVDTGPMLLMGWLADSASSRAGSAGPDFAAGTCMPGRSGASTPAAVDSQYAAHWMVDVPVRAPAPLLRTDMAPYVAHEVSPLSVVTSASSVASAAQAPVWDTWGMGPASWN